LLAASGLAFADTSLIDAAKNINIFELRNGVGACPFLIVGHECPSSNSLFYFECCGDALSSCCFKLQDWALCIVIVIIGLTILAMIINLIRCICCG